MSLKQIEQLNWEIEALQDLREYTTKALIYNPKGPEIASKKRLQILAIYHAIKLMKGNLKRLENEASKIKKAEAHKQKRDFPDYEFALWLEENPKANLRDAADWGFAQQLPFRTQFDKTESATEKNKIRALEERIRLLKEKVHSQNLVFDRMRKEYTEHLKSLIEASE